MATESGDYPFAFLQPVTGISPPNGFLWLTRREERMVRRPARMAP